MTIQHRSSAWPADRVAEARAVIADVAHHSDLLIRLACNVLAQAPNVVYAYDRNTVANGGKLTTPVGSGGGMRCAGSWTGSPRT